MRSVHSLSEWTRSHAAEAVRVLGKTNTRLSQPEVRMVVWPASIRHTDAELRAIWKFYNDSCHLLAPYGKISFDLEAMSDSWKQPLKLL